MDELLTAKEVTELTERGATLDDKVFRDKTGKAIAKLVASSCQEYFGCNTGNRAWNDCHWLCLAGRGGHDGHEYETAKGVYARIK